MVAVTTECDSQLTQKGVSDRKRTQKELPTESKTNKIREKYLSQKSYESKN